MVREKDGAQGRGGLTAAIQRLARVQPPVEGNGVLRRPARAVSNLSGPTRMVLGAYGMLLLLAIVIIVGTA